MSINPKLVRSMLDSDQQTADQLHELLTTERDLLQTREHQPLSQLIAKKDSLLENLNRHADERNAVLSSLGYTADTVGWQKLLASNPSLLALLPTWEALQSTLANCKELNEINGRLIGRSQQTLKRLLNIVRGQTGTPELYTAKGNAGSAGLGSTVAKA